VLLPQQDVDRLYDEVTSLIFNDWLLDKLRRNLKRIEVRNSLAFIADDFEALCSQNQPGSSLEKIRFS